MNNRELSALGEAVLVPDLLFLSRLILICSQIVIAGFHKNNWYLQKSNPATLHSSILAIRPDEKLDCFGLSKKIQDELGLTLPLCAVGAALLFKVWVCFGVYRSPPKSQPKLSAKPHFSGEPENLPRRPTNSL